MSWANVPRKEASKKRRCPKCQAWMRPLVAVWVCDGCKTRELRRGS